MQIVQLSHILGALISLAPEISNEKVKKGKELSKMEYVTFLFYLSKSSLFCIITIFDFKILLKVSRINSI